MSQQENYQQALESYLALVVASPRGVVDELARIFDRREEAYSSGRRAAAEISYITVPSVTAFTSATREGFLTGVRYDGAGPAELATLAARWDEGFATQWEQLA